jgi:hypothetical protein
MAVSIDAGTAVLLRVVVRNTLGSLVDPTELLLQIQAPDGVITQYAYSLLEITRESLGTFSKEVVRNAEGTHQYRWIASGAVVTEKGSWIYVRDSNIV